MSDRKFNRFVDESIARANMAANSVKSQKTGLDDFYEQHGRDRWHDEPHGYDPSIDLDDNMDDDPADRLKGNGALMDSEGDPLFEELYDRTLEELYGLDEFEESEDDR